MLMPKAKKLKEALPQIEKFRALAREIECDESEEGFDNRLKTLAKASRPPKAGT